MLYNRAEFYARGVHKEAKWLEPPGDRSTNFAQLFITEVPGRYFSVYYCIVRDGFETSDTLYCAHTDATVRELFNAAGVNDMGDLLDADYDAWDATTDGTVLDLEVSDADRNTLEMLASWVQGNN